MTEGRWPLPTGWKWVPAQAVGKIVGGSTPTATDPTNFADEDGVPWITPADLTGYEETYIGRGRRNLSKKGLASCGATVMPAGTVLYSSRAPIGYCAIASNPISTNQGFKSLVLYDGVVPEFVRYYMLSSKEYAESLASGTTFKELSGARMSLLPIPLASEKEQRRIVAKLDILLGRSKNARHELNHIPKLVARYKRAVLATAYRGDLTTNWRAESNGRPWRIETLGNLALDIRYGTATKCHYEPTATPVLRIPNVAAGGIDTTDLKFGKFEAREIDKLALKLGDLLVIRSNGSPDLVGRVAIVDSAAVGYLFAGYLIRLRLNEARVLPDYIALAFEEPSIRGVVERFAKSTSGVHNINSEQLRSLEIPLPPLAEQHEIIRRVRETLSQIDALLGETTKARALVDRLDRATIGKAFRGELIAPDPATTADAMAAAE